MIIVPEHNKRVSLIMTILSLGYAPWENRVSWSEVAETMGITAEGARQQYKRLRAVLESNGHTIEQFAAEVASKRLPDVSGDGYSYDELADTYTTIFSDGGMITVAGQAHRGMRDGYRADEGNRVSPSVICKTYGFPVQYWKEYADIHGFVRVGETLDYQENKAIIPQLKAARARIEQDAQKWQRFNLTVMTEINKALRGLKINSYPITIRPASKQMVILTPFIDLHFGKIGIGYNMEIATDRLRVATERLLGKIDPASVSRVVVPIGSDAINIDTLMGTTTAGTPQATARAIEVFQRFPKVLLETVDTIRSYFCGAQVEITPNSGNHDAMATIHQSWIVRAAYRDDPNLIVHDPASRTYIIHRNTLVCITHGDKMSDQRLAGVVAGEQAANWGRTKYRYALRGHYHRFSATPMDNQMVVIGVPALTGRDDWHDDKGYLVQSGAMAILFGEGLEDMKFYWA